MARTSGHGLTARCVALAVGVLLVLAAAMASPGTATAASSRAAAAFDAAAKHPTLVAGHLQDKPTKPPKPPKPPKPGRPGNPGAGGTPATDISSTMPRMYRDEITGDFLGRGYDQRMRAENTSLNIYDSPARSNAVLQSTSMDLAPAAGTVAYPCGINGSQICNAHPWSQYSQPSSFSCNGCFAGLWSYFELNTIYLARNNNNVFMAGSKGNSTISGYLTPYQTLLYVLPGDGSCASQGCAESTVSLPNMYNQCGSCVGEVRSIDVTSLAAGYVNGNPYLAVGLSDGGVQIYNVSNPTSPQLTDTYLGIATPNNDGSQTVPTALAWDPSGSGDLAIGVIEWANEGFFVHVNASGQVQPNVLKWSQQGGTALVPEPVSAAFGLRPDGTTAVAFGVREGDGAGTLRLVDPNSNGSTTDQLAQSSPEPGPIIAINPVPRFDNTGAGSDYAVSYQTTSVGTGLGGLLRWDGTSDPPSAQPVTAPPNDLTTDWDTFREWYPGIKEGRFQISNTSAEPITVALQESSSPGQGCWYAPSWADAPAFPAGLDSALTVPAGQTSATYTMGAYTAGPNGGCAATDATGTWRGYLVITPVNHPGDSRVVGLRMSRALSVDVDDTAGGSTTVTIQNTHVQLAALGLWKVVVGTPPAPAPQGSLTVVGSRLTPSDTPGSAVYRFDVTGATYQLPLGFQFGIENKVPPLIVQGSTDGKNWTTLGSLVPLTKPTIVFGTATSPAQLQLGPATFWWENATGPAYQFIHVTLGTSGPATQVQLSTLTPPGHSANVSGPQIAATNASHVATPVDSGMDQAPLSVQVLDAHSNPLPAGDPSYQFVYYRESASKALITNLFTGNGYTGVVPYAGAYPNDGSGPPPGTVFHYVSTTNSNDQTLLGFIAINAIARPAFSQPIEVDASSPGPLPSSTSNGIALTGCSDFGSGSNLCRLYPVDPGQAGVTPPRAGLFLDTSSGEQVGILTESLATTSAHGLPLSQTAGAPDRTLASAALTVSDQTAGFDGSSPFTSADTEDTSLLTHGELVPVQNTSIA
jgi:hypothetical protein